MQSTNRNMKHVKEQERVIKCQSPVISLRGYHGTGKTTTIAKFILNVLLTGMDKNILAVTLTKLAAANLKDELHKSSGWDFRFERQIKVGTFHSFAGSYVRKFARQIGFDSTFGIDKDINDRVLKKLIKGKPFFEIKKPIETLKDLYRSHVRSGRKIQKIVDASINDPKDRKLAARIMKKLKAEKMKMNVMDFDDMLYYFYKLCKKEPKVTEAVVRDFSHMVVDEFQDTTTIQWKIMKLLIKAGIWFLGAGDPFQTLFRYAGASLKRFDHLEAMRSCKRFELTENHRTTQQIIAIANAVLAQHQGKGSNKVWSEKNGPRPEVYLNRNMGLLCNAILEKIRCHIDKDGLTLNDMAVTFRNDSDVNYLKKEFEKLQIPYIFHSKEQQKTPEVVKVVQAILEISGSHPSRKPWQTILPLLSGVGFISKKTILSQLKENDHRYQALKDMTQGRYGTDTKRLLRLMQRLNLVYHNPVKTIKMTLKFLFGLKKNIGGVDIYSETLIAIARRSQDLEDLSLNLDDRSFGEYHAFKRHEKSDEFLTLANVHQIKGRGFKVVFYLGSYGTIFNKYHNLQDEETRIDEIFVMHTAIARSCRFLYFMFPMTYKNWRDNVIKNNPSTFIKKCPDHLYETFSIR